MSRTLPWINRLLLLASIALGAWAGLILARDGSPPPPSLRAIAVTWDKGQQRPARKSHPELLRRSLLLPPKTVTEVKRIERTAISPAAPALDTILRVVGVFRCSDPEKSTVVMELFKTQAQGIFRAGDEIDGILVESVGQDVVLAYAGSRYRVSYVSGEERRDGRWLMSPLTKASEAPSKEEPAEPAPEPNGSRRSAHHQEGNR